MCNKCNDKPTARLEYWSYDKVWHVFNGHIFDDVRMRFPDGSYIHTSHCVEPDAKEGDIIHTLNSTYLLGKPASI